LKPPKLPSFAFLAATLIGSLLALATAVFSGGLEASVQTISVNQLAYRGVFRLKGLGKMGAGVGLAYAPSRGTWFVLNGRRLNFSVLEIHLPDDPGFPGGPRPPAKLQAKAPAARMVQNWGPRLSVTNGGPLDPKHQDVYGAYWDDVTSRLYVSFGDYYGGAATNDCVLAIDFSVAPPALLGPWRFGHGATEFTQHWGYSQFVRAPASITKAAPTFQFLAAGHDGNTFQTGSWGPGLIAVADPADRKPRTILQAQQAMFWPSVTFSVTFDTGRVKPAIMSSNMLRRDPMFMISGNTSSYLGGAPQWRDVPYGRAPMPGGWANSDDAGHFVAIDEDDVKGLIYFGSYAVGTEWYGNPNEFADDYDVDPTSPTGFKSWAGIDAPGTQAYFQSPIFPLDPRSNPKGYVYDHQGGTKGNKQEGVVPAAWFYSMTDVIKALHGAYEPRDGLSPINVDPRSFAVLASPFAVPDLHPAFPTLQYDDHVNAYTSSAPRIVRVLGAYFRPTGQRGVERRLYVRMPSNIGGSATDVVNVFDLITDTDVR
jgi:hypothetical protein